MSEKLNCPQDEEVRGSGLMDKLKQTVPPVIGWCIFAGALVLAIGIALLVLL